MVLLLLVVAILILAIISWAYLLNDCKRLNVVGPFPLPLVGNGLLFLGDAARKYCLYVMKNYITAVITFSTIKPFLNS